MFSSAYPALHKGSEIRPLILAYEDLHWMDESSEDVLKYLLESIPGARILMIFTYRPEFVHTWVTIARLSRFERRFGRFKEIYPF